MAGLNYITRNVIDIVCLAIVGIPLIIFYTTANPYQRGLWCNDESINLPFKDSTVTNAALYVIGLVFPIISMLLTEFVLFRTNVCKPQPTAEVESAMVEHKAVAEAAVIGIPHPVKGQCLYVFVTTKDGFIFDPSLVHQLKLKVRELIGPFAVPDYIQSAPGLPKTRSGKIMRRILRKIALNDDDYGDTSTLMDESIVQVLLALRPCEIMASL